MCTACRWNGVLLGARCQWPDRYVHYGQPIPRAHIKNGLEGAAQLTISAFYTCVLITDGSVRCWGNNLVGELGSPAAGSHSDDPVTVSGIAGAVAITNNGGVTCGLLEDGAVSCWGPGIAATGPIPGLAGITRLYYYCGGMCGLQPDGTVLTWFGEDMALRVMPGLSNPVDIAADNTHSCAALASGSVVCWGTNESGELGDGTTTDRDTPTEVLGLSDVDEVVAMFSSSCAHKRSGEVYCWGSNWRGELGDGTDAQLSTSPVQVQLAP